MIGPDIRSFCTPDGTWEPYPTCDGDIRDTRDGCDGCPGEFGGARNRTAEAAGGKVMFLSAQIVFKFLEFQFSFPADISPFYVMIYNS